MKNLRKPLSVFLAVIMLFGIFAGALTTFAAGAVQENVPFALDDENNTFTFTPEHTGFFVLALDAKTDSDWGPDLNAYASYGNVEEYGPIYNISVDENMLYKVFKLDEGVKYSFTVEEYDGNWFDATATFLYSPVNEVKEAQVYNVDGFGVYKFTSPSADNCILSVKEKYKFYDWMAEGNYAKTILLSEVDSEEEEGGKEYNSVGGITDTYSYGDIEKIDEEYYNQDVTINTLAPGLKADVTYYAFVIAGTTVGGTEFSIKGISGTAINIVNLDMSAAKSDKLGFGSDFLTAEDIKVMSLNKDYFEFDMDIDDDEEQEPDIPTDAVRISNVRFVKYNKEAYDKNSNYWATAPATDDPYMKDDYFMVYDIDVNGKYFLFDPAVRFFYNPNDTSDYDYPWGTVSTDEKITVAERVDASTIIKDGIEYNVDTQNNTATVCGYSNGNQKTFKIPEKLSINGINFTVTTIGTRAFEGSNATSITIPKTVTEICYRSLANTQITSTTIPEKVAKVSPAAFYGNKKLKTINVTASNAKYSAVNGILYNKNKTLLHTYPAGATATAITIPSPVRTIGDSAFSGTAKLKSISLNKVTALEPAAFYDCSVENTTVPAAVKTIPESAYAASNIKNIVILGATKIDEYAFEGTSGLKEIFIPKTVTSIGKNAFRYSKLTKIVFAKGSKLASLGDFAFGYEENWNWDEATDTDTVTVEPIKGFTACYFTSDTKVRPLLNKLQKNIKAKKAINYIPISNNNIAKCTITLGKAATYKGKNITPGVVVKSGKYVLKKGVDYTVTYSNNKLVGRAVVTITGKGSFVGKVKKTFNILPKGTKLSSVKGGKKSLTVKWAKQATQTNGYQIQCSLKKNFAGAKIIKVGKNTTAKRIAKLAGGKRYYVRIRTYRTIGKITFCSAWSGAKFATTKK